MTDFKKQYALNVESQMDEQYVAADGTVRARFVKRLAAVAGTFGNAGGTTLAHGIATPAIDLTLPFNVRLVNCQNGTITVDKSKISFTADVTNINISTASDLHLYAGEIVIEYSKVGL